MTQILRRSCCQISLPTAPQAFTYSDGELHQTVFRLPPQQPTKHRETENARGTWSCAWQRYWLHALEHLHKVLCLFHEPVQLQLNIIGCGCALMQYRMHGTIRIADKNSCKLAQPCATPAQLGIGWPGTSRATALWERPWQKDASDSKSEIATCNTHQSEFAIEPPSGRHMDGSDGSVERIACGVYWRWATAAI